MKSLGAFVDTSQSDALSLDWSPILIRSKCLTSLFQLLNNDIFSTQLMNIDKGRLT